MNIHLSIFWPSQLSRHLELFNLNLLLLTLFGGMFHDIYDGLAYIRAYIQTHICIYI